MTDRLAEIEARLKAATPGPWELRDGIVAYKSATLATVYDAEDFPCASEEDYDEIQAEGRANARVIANAPSDIAWLIAELRLARLAAGVAGSTVARLHDEARACSCTVIASGRLDPEHRCVRCRGMLPYRAAGNAGEVSRQQRTETENPVSGSRE